MNIVDYVILGVIGLSVLWGFYRGFVQSVLNMGGCLLAFVGSFFLYPTLANAIQNNQELVRSLIHFTDATSRVGDLELSLSNVAGVTQNSLTALLQNVRLPAPLDSLLSYNIENQVFAPIGITTVAEYVNQTIITVSVNILCFLACFLALYIVLSILINMLKCVFRFPLLKQLDWLVGGVFGALRGVVLCYAVFILVPLLSTVIPFEQFNDVIRESILAQFFNNGSLILSVMNRRL